MTTDNPEVLKVAKELALQPYQGRYQLSDPDELWEKLGSFARNRYLDEAEIVVQKRKKRDGMTVVK